MTPEQFKELESHLNQAKSIKHKLQCLKLDLEKACRYKIRIGFISSQRNNGGEGWMETKDPIFMERIEIATIQLLEARIKELEKEYQAL